MGTAIGLVFTQFGLPIVDVILATILGFLIIYTGFGIFRESIFALSDGFNEQDLEAVPILTNPSDKLSFAADFNELLFVF
jgi:divalent metal cation (Fe/Co/Zn/Cd) transporter